MYDLCVENPGRTIHVILTALDMVADLCKQQQRFDRCELPQRHDGQPSTLIGHIGVLDGVTSVKRHGVQIVP